VCSLRRGKHGDIGSLLPGNAAVNMDSQKCETVFSVGSVKGVTLKTDGTTSSVLSSEFSVEDSHGRFVVEKSKESACGDLVCE
jgi:hypothetical protein